MDSGVSAYQGGASLGRSLGAAGAGFAAGYAGYQLGSAYGEWAGLGDFGSALFGSIGANVGASTATAAVLGGDIGDAALGGLAGGTIAGPFSYFGVGYIGLPLAGGTSAEIQGGDFWEGAGEGFLAFAATAGVQALQAGRPRGNPTAAIIREELEAADPNRSVLKAPSIVKWVAEGPLDVAPGKWSLKQTIPPMIWSRAGVTNGAEVIGIYTRQVTNSQFGHYAFLGGKYRGSTYNRSWTTTEVGHAWTSVTYSPASSEVGFRATEPIKPGFYSVWDR